MRIEAEREQRSLVPWRAKLAMKLVLSRLPLDYQVWKRIGIFKHGRMEDPGYAFTVCKVHFDQFLPSSPRPFTVLELGPGDSAGSALVARALGASDVFLVDVGPFARKDAGLYRSIQTDLLRRGLRCPDFGNVATFAEILGACNASYLTEGLQSLRTLPDRSVDFVWSHAVLEHVLRDDFAALQQQLRRILRSGGMCSHQIDLRDHLNMRLNSLRFSRDRWESKSFVHSGFYTNRLRVTEILDSFSRAGFQKRIVHETRWSKVPISRTKLAPEFQTLSDDELRVSGFHLIAW
jgi:SAM-dependent methyltransferase